MTRITVISRDPFARMDIIRETVPASERGECTECGQPAHYRYGTEPDSITVRRYIVGKLFCSIGCARAYGGIIP